MTENQERKIEISVHDGGFASIALDNAHIEAQQNNSKNINENTPDITDNYHYLMKKRVARVMMAIIIAGGIGLLSYIFFKFSVKQSDDEKSTADINTLQQDEGDELYSNSLYLKAKALQVEGKYLDAAVIYNELYGSLSNAKEYQLEIIKFWEAYAYFNQFLYSEGAESKYGYRAIEIFEKIINTENEENEDIRLMSLGCLLLLGNNINDVDYEKKMADYCKMLEVSMLNYKTTDTEDYNTYNTRTISYYALAEYYQNRILKDTTNETAFEYTESILFYYQEALENCRGMIKCGQGAFDSKRIEIIVLKRLSIYYPLFYMVTKEDKYLSAAESCFDELQTKVDLNTDRSMYIDSMLHIARGNILINDKESLDEAYEILNSLFYYVCKDEEELCYVGNFMIQTGLATEADIENIKNYYFEIIEKLEKEKNIQKYVNMVYDIAYCDWLLVCQYQDSDAYEEGYIYLLHLQDAYFDLVENDVKERILELKKCYDDLQE